jgi:hypothetical protein
MAEMKTRATGQPVAEFLGGIADEQLRKDCVAIQRMMEKATKSRGRMWGKIVGFGSRKLRYADGREVDWMVIAFAPRAKSIALYLGRMADTYPKLADRLGKHTGGGTSCLHVKRLSDVHVPTLNRLIVAAAKEMGRKRTAGC